MEEKRGVPASLAGLLITAVILGLLVLLSPGDEFATTRRLLGLGEDRLVAALSNAWLDGQALRTYRHAPNTGSRKSWAAGDATARAVWLALLAERGEPGYPSALTAPDWGFQDVLFRGADVRLAQPLGTYVMDNVLFKVAVPAEFHAQTAAECALALHPEVRDRIHEIERIEIENEVLIPGITPGEPERWRSLYATAKQAGSRDLQAFFTDAGNHGMFERLRALGVWA